MEKNSSYSLLQLFLSRVKRLFPSEVGTKKNVASFLLQLVRKFDDIHFAFHSGNCYQSEEVSLRGAPEKYFLNCGGKKKKKKRKERNNIRFRGKATALISNRVTTVSFPRRQGNNSPHDVMEFDERQRIVELFPRLKKRLLITFINSFKL